MSSRKKLTIHDYNARLPENLTFIQFNGSRERSLLKCSHCNYQDLSWGMCPRYASDKTKCPKCKNVPDPLKEASKKLPENLTYIQYVDSHAPATYKCDLCNYKGTITPHKVTSNTRCKSCRGTGESKIDRLNADLSHNFKFVSYVNSYSKSTVQCLTCSHTWTIVPKNISDGTKCGVCKMNVDKKEFDNFLSDNYLISSVIPKTITAKHEFICDFCSRPVTKSVRKITRGAVCNYCAKNRKQYDAKRCQIFADKHNITFKLVEIEHPDYSYSWICDEDHTSKLSLAGIKRKIFDPNRKSWCDRCEIPKNKDRLHIIAKNRGGKWIPGIGGYTKDNYHYKFECSLGHEFYVNVDNILDNNEWCDICEGEILITTFAKLDFQEDQNHTIENIANTEAWKMDKERKELDQRQYQWEKRIAQRTIAYQKEERANFEARQNQWFHGIEHGFSYEVSHDSIDEDL